MLRLLLIGISFLATVHLNAATIADLYGDAAQADTIVKKYAQQVSELETSFINELSNVNNGDNNLDENTDSDWLKWLALVSQGIPEEYIAAYLGLLSPAILSVL